MIYAGGDHPRPRITVGRGSTIGGSVWLTHSVPPNSQITQAQLRSNEPDRQGWIGRTRDDAKRSAPVPPCPHPPRLRI